MECPNCQTKNRTGARFCATCGSPLPEMDSGAILEPEGAHELPAQNVAAPPETREQTIASEAMALDSEFEEAIYPDDEPGAIADEAGQPNHMPADDLAEEALEVTDEGTDTAGDAEQAVKRGLAPLPAGTVLADRYEIIELMSSDSGGNAYLAFDLARCAVCGFEGNVPADEYCADCGAALSSPLTCQIREQSAISEPEAVARFDANGRTYVVLIQEEIAEAQSGAPASSQQIRLRWGVRTDRGLVRDLNEDHLDVHVYATQGGPTLGLFIVADGVGGQAAGEVASQLATQVIWDKIREAVWLPELQGEPVLPETMQVRVEEAVQAANQAVYRQRTQQGNDMGTTITLALLRDAVAVIANVGDSRTYLWNAEGLRQLTVDHSLVQSLIEAGELEPEEIYTHSHRHIIHRSIGDRPRVEMDTFVRELTPGDRLLLCSDGLWEMARNEGIEEILLLEPDPETACHALVDLANLAGGSDNISVIIVHLALNQ